MAHTLPLIVDMFACRADNYGYLVHSPLTGETAAIDTPDASMATKHAKANGWSLTHIWNTHHHPDHVGGNHDLKSAFPDIKIFGSEADRNRIPGMTDGFSDGETFMFGGHEVTVLETPGHTLHHIIFHVPSENMAFVGDTIFAAGCGRLFEGTPTQMFKSLAKIARLPASTRLYCAHEYTLANIKFAVTVEPENADLKSFIEDAKDKRAAGQPTIPTTVGSELKYNPFMRAATAEALGDIRKAKDNF